MAIINIIVQQHTPYMLVLKNTYVLVSQECRCVFVRSMLANTMESSMSRLECVNYALQFKQLASQSHHPHPIVAKHTPHRRSSPQHYLVHQLGFTSSIQISRQFWNPNKQSIWNSSVMQFSKQSHNNAIGVMLSFAQAALTSAPVLRQHNNCQNTTESAWHHNLTCPQSWPSGQSRSRGQAKDMY